MEGEVKIICKQGKGVQVACNLGVGEWSDRLFLVHALGKSLALEARDYMTLAVAETEGALNNAPAPTIIQIDKEQLLKQLKEDSNDES